jgi:hypothetical protein
MLREVRDDRPRKLYQGNEREHTPQVWHMRPNGHVRRRIKPGGRARVALLPVYSPTATRHPCSNWIAKAVGTAQATGDRGMRVMAQRDSSYFRISSNRVRQ